MEFHLQHDRDGRGEQQHEDEQVQLHEWRQRPACMAAGQSLEACLGAAAKLRRPWQRMTADMAV